jgi:hypothetical protein
MGKKGRLVRTTVSMTSEAISAAGILAQKWNVPISEVHRIMHARGLSIEAALAADYEVQLVRGSEKVKLPEDRPLPSPFSAESLIRYLTKEDQPKH